MVHASSLKRSIYSKTQKHRVPAHGANIAVGTALAAFGGALIPSDPLSGTVAVAIASAMNAYSAWHVTSYYNEARIGYE